MRDPFDNFTTDDTVRSALRKAGVVDTAMPAASALREALSTEVAPLVAAIESLNQRLDRIEGR